MDLLQLELGGTARYPGLLLAPAEGFGLWPRLFTLFVIILGNFWCSVVTSVIFSSNISNFKNKTENLKKSQKIQNLKNSEKNKKNKSKRLK